MPGYGWIDQLWSLRSGFGKQDPVGKGRCFVGQPQIPQAQTTINMKVLSTVSSNTSGSSLASENRALDIGVY